MNMRPDHFHTFAQKAVFFEAARRSGAVAYLPVARVARPRALPGSIVSDLSRAGSWLCLLSTLPRLPHSQNRNTLNVTDGRIFWWSLYLTPAVWVLLGVVCVLKFNLSYLLLVVVALVLSSANIVGYYKCSKDATEHMRAYVQQTVLGAAMDRFLP